MKAKFTPEDDARILGAPKGTLRDVCERYGYNYASASGRRSILRARDPEKRQVQYDGNKKPAPAGKPKVGPNLARPAYFKENLRLMLKGAV